MADDIDQAAEMTELHLERSIAAARVPIARGRPGMCEGCCEDHERLVLCVGLELCPPCRDKREKRR